LYQARGRPTSYRAAMSKRPRSKPDLFNGKPAVPLDG
jgi:hypothetical protein